MLENSCGHGFRARDPTALCYRGPDSPNYFDLACIHPTPAGHDVIRDLFTAVIDESSGSPGYAAPGPQQRGPARVLLETRSLAHGPQGRSSRGVSPRLGWPGRQPPRRRLPGALLAPGSTRGYA